MTIQTMDRAAAKVVRERIDAALKAVAADLGLAYDGAGNSTFDPADNSVRFKSVSFRVPGSERKTFEAYAQMYGLKPAHFGCTFRRPEGEYKVVGLDTKRRSAYCVKAENVTTGKVLLFKAAAIANITV